MANAPTTKKIAPAKPAAKPAATKAPPATQTMKTLSGAQSDRQSAKDTTELLVVERG